MKKKTLTIAIALVLVVALAVGATWAYLTAQTAEVKNTFVAGKIIDQNSLKLYEHVAEKQDDGTYQLTNAVATPDNNGVYNTYTVMPGVNLPKDPTVEVSDNTSTGEYYLFVKVTAGTAYSKNGPLSYTVDTTKWMPLAGADGVYVYTENGTDAAILTGNLAATKVLTQIGQTDNTITVSSNETQVASVTTETATLTFQAYACQAAGMTPLAAYQEASK